jgi:hypothetical protein
VQNKILRNFWNCTGTVLLVSMTFLKKVICEKTFIFFPNRPLTLTLDQPMGLT